MSSYPTCNREFQKKLQKISKNLKKTLLWLFLSQNRLGKAEKERK